MLYNVVLVDIFLNAFLDILRNICRLKILHYIDFCFEDLKEKYVYPQELFSMVLGIQKAPINVAKQTHTYKG